MKMYKTITLTLQRLAWLPTRLGFKFFCHLETIGIQNVSEKKAIFASNHISELDPILIAACLPFLSSHLPLFYTSREKGFYKDKKRLKKILYGGIFFKAWGAYQVYVGLKNYEYALRNHIHILLDNSSVCIFPEGKRSSENEKITAKGGVAYLAHRTNVPIIPVRIHGLKQTSLLDFLLRKRVVKVVFGEPIYIKDLFADVSKITVNEHRNDYVEAAVLIMKKVKALQPPHPFLSVAYAKQLKLCTQQVVPHQQLVVPEDPTVE